MWTHPRRRAVTGAGAILLAVVVCTVPAAAQVAEVPVVLPGHGEVVEGNAGTTVLEVPVTLSIPSAEVVTVDWVPVFLPQWTFPAAEPGVDYAAGSGTVTFPPGVTAQTVPIVVSGDVDMEADELVVLSFRNSTNATMGGAWGIGTGTILDDDTPPRALVVEPATDLQDLQVVTVRGSWFTPFASVGVCQSDAVIASTPANSCLGGAGGASITNADASGGFVVSFTVHRQGFVPARGAVIDCSAPSTPCVMGAGELNDLVGTGVTVPLSFASPPA